MLALYTNAGRGRGGGGGGVRGGGASRGHQPGSNLNVIPCKLPGHVEWPQSPNLLSGVSNGRSIGGGAAAGQCVNTEDRACRCSVLFSLANQAPG